jgi:tetratricopeptide (TPR) repeat protein
MVRASQGHEDADAWFAKAVARPGVPAELVGSYARALVTSGRMDEARRWLLKAYRLGDRDPDSLTILGRLALEQENFPAAQRYLDQAVEAGPENFQAHVLLIEALRALGLQKRREQVILRSLELAPSREVKSRLYMSLGALQELQQRYEAAAESYYRAASWKPVRGNSLVQAAWNYYQAGRFAKAMGAIDQAREILGPTQEVQRLVRRIELARFGPPEQTGGSGWFENAPVLPEKDSQQASSERDRQESDENPTLLLDPGLAQPEQP